MPSTIHCDHLIEAQQGAEKDLAKAKVKLCFILIWKWFNFACFDRMSILKFMNFYQQLLLSMEWVFGSQGVESSIR